MMTIVDRVGFGLWGLMMVLAVTLLVLGSMMGCTSVSYGPLKANSLASNTNVKSVKWIKVAAESNTVIEALEVEGYNRDEVKGTKTIGNVIGMISGGLIGSAAGPATAAGGALAGAGAAELLQRYLDGIKPAGNIIPAVTPGAITNSAPVSPVTNSPSTTSCGCDLSGPLVDGPYDAAYMAANANFEECHIEPATGLMVRYAVWIPSQNCFWLQSSIGDGHVKKAGDYLVAECHTTKGFRYHVRGFAIGEPHAGESNPALVAAGNECKYDGSRRYVIAECRKQ